MTIDRDISAPVVAVLGLGGTIAGQALLDGSPHYVAAQRSVAHLMAQLPQASTQALISQGWHIDTEQIAQVDSKDMAWPVWRPLLETLQRYLLRPDVRAVVVTHGTDTLEETALLLHLLLPASTKPVVLTAAMRAANTPQADGPRNLADALQVACWAADEGRHGVCAVMCGQVWAATSLRKVHTWSLDAFDGGGDSPLAAVDAHGVHASPGAWPLAQGWAEDCFAVSSVRPWPEGLPRVGLLTAHADADEQSLAPLLAPASPTLAWQGVVLAGTGHGTLPTAWAAGLRLAHARGVVIWRSTRVPYGGVNADKDAAFSPWPATGQLTASQARLALSLALWCRPQVLLAPRFGGLPLGHG